MYAHYLFGSSGSLIALCWIIYWSMKIPLYTLDKSQK